MSIITWKVNILSVSKEFYVFQIFDRYISNVVNKNFLYDFSSILILFGSKFVILIKSSKKVVCLVFYGYIFEFKTYVWFVLLLHSFF